MGSHLYERDISINELNIAFRDVKTSIVIKKYQHIFNRNGVQQLSNRELHEQQLLAQLGFMGFFYCENLPGVFL